MKHEDSKKDNTSPKDTQAKVASKRAAVAAGPKIKPKGLSKKAERKGREAIERTANRLERLVVEYVPIDSIYPNTYNPNRQSEHQFELLLKSIEEDGFTQPVLVQVGTDLIVDGEHRWRAAATLGMTEIPIVRIQRTEAEMRISTFRHNRSRGEEDIELSAQVLRDLRELGALDQAKDSLMLDDLEVSRLMEDIKPTDVLGNEEFSEAWIPDRFTPEEKTIISGSDEATKVSTRVDTSGAVVDSAMTHEAIQRQRKREELIAQAKTEQDREQARQETKLYRVSLVFSGAEADVVKAALGEKPAEVLLQMCKDKIGYTGPKVVEQTQPSPKADGSIIQG